MIRGRTALTDMLQVRHRVCMCFTEDGSGKPIRCHKKPPSEQLDGLVYQECLAGCGHWHGYSEAYLRHCKLFDIIVELGEEKVIEILETARNAPKG